MSISRGVCILAIALAFCFPVNAIAEHEKNSHHFIRLQEKAKAKNLSDHPFWRALLHYKTNHSSIRDAAFFVASEGCISPEAELDACIHAFFSAELDARRFSCRFPARYLWLCRQLDIAPSPFDCPELKSYLKRLSATQISMVYTSESFKYVGSMMGHLFLKIDGEDSGGRRSHALGFYAVLPENGSFSMFYDALFSSLNGNYILKSYRNEVEKYCFKEQRNMVEIPLGLSMEQRDFLMYHVWELKNINVDYNFVSYNCGTGILDVIRVGAPESVDMSQLFQTPKGIVKTMMSGSHAGDVYFRPTLEYTIRLLSEHLSEQEKKLAASVRKNHDLTALDGISDSYEGQRVLILLRSELVYQAFTNRRDIGNDQRVLLEQINAAVEPSLENAVLTDQYNEFKERFNANGSSSLSVGVAYKGQPVLNVGISPVYNWLESDNSEYFKEFQFKLLSAEFDYYLKDRAVLLDTFDVVDFKTYVPFKPLIKGTSAEVRLSFEQEGLEGEKNKLYPHMVIGLGRTKALYYDRFQYYGFLRVGDAYYDDKNVAYVGPEVGFFLKNRSVKINGSIEQIVGTSHYKYETKLRASCSFFVGKGRDVSMATTLFSDNSGHQTIQACTSYTVHY